MECRWTYWEARKPHSAATASCQLNRRPFASGALALSNSSILVRLGAAHQRRIRPMWPRISSSRSSSGNGQLMPCTEAGVAPCPTSARIFSERVLGIGAGANARASPGWGPRQQVRKALRPEPQGWSPGHESSSASGWPGLFRSGSCRSETARNAPPSRPGSVPRQSAVPGSGHRRQFVGRQHVVAPVHFVESTLIHTHTNSHIVSACARLEARLSELTRRSH